MSDYLKRLHIDSVEEVGVNTTNSAYLKRVEITEIVDSDGNPWEPVPGPDPWDQLAVVDKAQWSDGNVYAVGETISGVSATYVGGTDQVIYRSRVQHRPYGSDSWINSPWTNHENTPQVVQFTIPEGEEGGEVRFQTQARDNSVDPVDQVNSFASVKNIDWAPLVMSTPVVTGDLYVGEVITCAEPTVTGGKAPYQFTYRWKSVNIGESWATGSSVEIPPHVAGKSGYCQVTVTDDVGTTISDQSATLGPITYTPLVVNTTTVSGTPYAGETITCEQPTVTGGKTPYTYSYMWLDANAQSVNPASNSNSTTIGVYDVGKVMNCYVTVTSDDGQTGNTTTTNGVGPIGQYTIGTATGQVDGAAYDPLEDVINVIQGQSNVLTVARSGDSPNITYTWTVRQGDVRITPSGAMCTIVHQSDPPQGAQVQCDLIDNYASDDNQAIRFAFFVNE